MGCLCTLSHVAILQLGKDRDTPLNNTALFIGDSNVAPKVQDDSTLDSHARSTPIPGHGQLRFDVKPVATTGLVVIVFFAILLAWLSPRYYCLICFDFAVPI